MGTGRRRVDWVYLEDVVDALLRIAVSPACVGQTVDVGTGATHSVRHVVETICELFETDVEPVWGGLPDRPGEAEAAADVERTRALSGWSPSTELVAGLAGPCSGTALRPFATSDYVRFGLATLRTSSCSSSNRAAATTTEYSMPDRSAMSSRLCSPSDWLSTHSIANSRSGTSVPPSARYRPRLPSCGSPKGCSVCRYAVAVDDGHDLLDDGEGLSQPDAADELKVVG